MTILVATDFSEPSSAALQTGARIARARDTKLTVVHFVASADTPPWDQQFEMPRDVEDELRGEASEHLRSFCEETVSEDLRPADTELRIELGAPEEGLSGLADSENAEMIVLGATGRNRVAEFLLGSTTERIVRSSDRPVLVVPADAASGSYDRIVAPVDFSECSRRSLEHAASVAREEGAALEIVHSYLPPTSDVSGFSPMITPERIQEVEKRHEQKFEEFVGTFDLEDLAVQTHLQVGAPHATIVDVVEEHDADLVVMGTHGRRGFEKFFLGSTAAKVLRRMPCSVMTIRTRDEG